MSHEKITKRLKKKSLGKQFKSAHPSEQKMLGGAVEHQDQETPSSSAADIVMNIIKLPFQYPKLFFILALLLLSGGIAMSNRRNQGFFIEEDDVFKLVKGDPTKAKWIILGDHHEYRDETGRYVEKITQNIGQHMILVESISAGVIANCTDYFIRERPDRSCVGWDDPHCVVELWIEQSFLQHLSILHRLKKQHKLVAYDAQLDEFLLEYAHYFHEERERRLAKLGHKEIDDVPLELDTISIGERNVLIIHQGYLYCMHLQEMRKQGSSYKEIFAKKEPTLTAEIAYYKSKAYKPESFLVRNKSLMKALQQSHGLFTVAIAGKGHVTEVTESLDEAALYVQNELEKGKDQNPYAILATKH